MAGDGDLIFKYRRSKVEQAIEELGYDPDVYTVSDILFYVYDGLIDDIRGNETTWPVDTGFSRASFNTDGTGLYNDAPYAKYLEGRGNHIGGYAPFALDGLVENALELIGAVKGMQDPLQRMENRFETVASILDRVRNPLSGLVDMSRYRRFGPRNRRLLRTFAPRAFDIDEFYRSFR